MKKFPSSNLNIVSIISLLFISTFAFTWISSKRLLEKRKGMAMSNTDIDTIFDVDKFLKQQVVTDSKGNCPECNRSVYRVTRNDINAVIIPKFENRPCIILIWKKANVSVGHTLPSEGTVINDKCMITYDQKSLQNASVVVFDNQEISSIVPWKNSR